MPSVQHEHQLASNAVHQLSSPGNSPAVTLENRGLWAKFNEPGLGMEMVLAREGRVMFPSVTIAASGLSPVQQYSVKLRVVAVDFYRYKFSKLSRFRWHVNGRIKTSEASFTSRQEFIHPHSPASGEHWQKEPIEFKAVKLTNNRKAKAANLVLLESLRKYTIEIVVQDTMTSTENVFPLPETAFIAVTAYQNKKTRQLKIDYNPYARGFRKAIYSGSLPKQAPRMGAHYKKKIQCSRLAKSNVGPMAIIKLEHQPTYSTSSHSGQDQELCHSGGSANPILPLTSHKGTSCHFQPESKPSLNTSSWPSLDSWDGSMPLGNITLPRIPNCNTASDSILPRVQQSSSIVPSSESHNNCSSMPLSRCVPYPDVLHIPPTASDFSTSGTSSDADAESDSESANSDSCYSRSLFNPGLPQITTASDSIRPNPQQGNTSAFTTSATTTTTTTTTIGAAAEFSRPWCDTWCPEKRPGEINRLESDFRADVSDGLAFSHLDPYAATTYRDNIKRFHAILESIG